MSVAQHRSRRAWRTRCALLTLGATALVPAAAFAFPVNTVPPAAPTGTLTVGSTLTADTGTWTGATYVGAQWQECDASGGSCVDIAGAGAGTYTLRAGQKYKTIRVGVQGLSGIEISDPVYSATTGQVEGEPIGGAASITGTATVGQTLTASSSGWTAAPAVNTTTYQWQRCDADGMNCVSIAGATGGTYSLVPADYTNTVRVVATVSNGRLPDGTATSSTTAAVAGVAPTGGTASITGTTTVGQTLTAGSSGWLAAPAVTSTTYQWKRCDAGGANCAHIAGATAVTYTATAADVGRLLAVSVTATNSLGSTTATRTASAQVRGTAPANTAAPTVAGTAAVDSDLTLAKGEWSGIPAPDLAIAWQRCDATGEGCSTIAGATGTSYRVTDTDAGYTLRANVTATNTEGTASKASHHTAVVPARPAPARPDDTKNTTGAQPTTTPTNAAAPTNTAAPTISGRGAYGHVLTATSGSWSPTPALGSVGYQWQSCVKTRCFDIPGATTATYRVSASDIGAKVRVVITARSSAGTATTPTAPLTVARLTKKTAATFTRTTIVGPAAASTPLGVVVVLPKRIKKAGVDSITYRWYRCTPPQGYNCRLITTTPAARYTPKAADRGTRLRVKTRTTLRNGETITSRFSAPTLPVR